jgi:hypothetical protein
MPRWSRARWNPVPNYSGATSIRSVCLHHQAGYGDPASVYITRGVSAHFWIPRAGEPVQHVDTAWRAWHGGTNALNTYAIGVETEGCGSPPHAEPLTENQLDVFADLMRWAHTTHGVPLVLSESADTAGLNYHRCAGGFATACPCDVRLNARAEILARAGGAAPTPPTPTTKAAEMIASTSTGKGYWTATYDGAVGAFGDAQYHGNVYGKLAGTAIVGIAGKGADGYWLLGSDGGVFAFGSAGYYGRPDRV